MKQPTLTKSTCTCKDVELFVEEYFLNFVDTVAKDFKDVRNDINGIAIASGIAVGTIGGFLYLTRKRVKYLESRIAELEGMNKED